jgi:hypothetical protein
MSALDSSAELIAIAQQARADARQLRLVVKRTVVHARREILRREKTRQEEPLRNGRDEATS